MTTFMIIQYQTLVVSLPEMLAEESSLTRKQFEALVMYSRVAAHEMKYREAASLMSKPVTIGSYYRTVQQGRDEVRESMATMLVAIKIGLVKLEDVRRLFEVIGKEGVQVAEHDDERFVDLVRTLLKRIVM